MVLVFLSSRIGRLPIILRNLKILGWEEWVSSIEAFDPTLAMSIPSRLLFRGRRCGLDSCLRLASSSSSSTPQLLAHEWVSRGDHKKTMLLMHGLLGNSKNLRSYAKLVSKNYPTWQIILVDLRGHGRTPQLNTVQAAGETCTVANAAEDIAFTLDSMGAAPPDVVCGHSLGGKIALAFLDGFLSGQYSGYFGLQEAEPPSSTWILDSVPASVDRSLASGSEESVASVLEAVSRVAASGPVASKADLVEKLLLHGTSTQTAQWMTTNLEPGPSGGFNFVFDTTVCRALFDSYSVTSYLPLLEVVAAGQTEDFNGEPCSVDIVRAGKNVSAWPQSLLQSLEKVTGEYCRLHVLPASGHNVHIDSPRGLLQLMGPTFAAER